MVNLFNYIDRPSPIHRLTGASKLVCLLAWSVAAMTSFYTPLLLALTVLAVVLFHCLVSDSAAAVAVSEVLAVLAEAALYRRFGSEKLRPALLFSLCANVFSFCCGLLLNIVVFKLSTAPY